MDELGARLVWLCNILKSASHVSYSMLDTNGNVCYTNMPHVEIFDLFIAKEDSKEGTQEKIDELFSGLEEVSTEGMEKLHVFTNPLGMSWISIIETRRKKIFRVHVLGPVFLDEHSTKKMRRRLDDLQLSVAMRHHFTDVMQSYPAIGLNRFYEYGRMLYYAITQEEIRIDEFGFSALGAEEGENMPPAERRSGAYEEEQKILSLVEEGNLNYRQEMARMKIKSSREETAGEYFRYARNQVLVFTALCSRAAVSGGVDPEIAYTLRERFMEEAEGAADLGELNRINETMLEAFVSRVHRAKIKGGISPQMMRICDYIGLHLKEEISAHDLAQKLGYKDYYFTARFKEETGRSLREYIREKRIAAACEMLSNTNKDIVQISEELGFLSRSYFGKIFKRMTGVSPKEYRTKVHLQKEAK